VERSNSWEVYLRWALIGASTIAAEYMIQAIRAIPGGTVQCVLSSSPNRGAEYAAKHQIPASGTDLSVVLADPRVDAVYISTTNEKHFPQAMAAIAAGKHVLCEKPLGMTLDEACEMVRAAESRGTVPGATAPFGHSLKRVASGGFSPSVFTTQCIFRRTCKVGD
jgi:1,5-anhydro-D-fructose reductase (1,5-anhydro-D-mannitol-forming)